MADLKPIPIPLGQHWRQFRTRLLPLLVFGFAVVAIFSLWERESAPGVMVGEVYAPFTVVNAPRAGWIEAEPLEIYQRVEAGEEIGILRIVPPEHAKLALAVLQEEIRMIRLGVGDPILDQQRNLLSWQGLRRDWMLVRSDLASLRVQLRQAEVDRDRYKDLAAKGADTRLAYEQALASFDSLKAEVQEKARLADELEKVVSDARASAGTAETPAGAGAGIAAALDWKEAELRNLEAEIAPISITAPFTGIITRILRHPGDFANAGEPVVELRSDKPEFVIAWLKPPLAVEPKPGMTVEVVSRRLGRSVAGRAKVLGLGPQFEPVPTVFQRPLPVNIEERALPLRISLPPQLALRPGEVVDIRMARQ